MERIWRRKTYSCAWNSILWRKWKVQILCQKFLELAGDNFRLLITWKTRKMWALFLVKEKTFTIHIKCTDICEYGEDYTGETEQNTKTRWWKSKQPEHKSEPARHILKNHSMENVSPSTKEEIYQEKFISFNDLLVDAYIRWTKRICNLSCSFKKCSIEWIIKFEELLLNKNHISLLLILISLSYSFNVIQVAAMSTY